MAETWFLTGATGGLGYAIARAALIAGDNLVATARKPERLDDLVRDFGAAVRVLALDVCDRAAVRSAVNVPVDEFGSLDVLLNNAGFANSVAAEDLTDAELRAHFETNFFGTVNVTTAALPILRRQGSGRIIQMSSIVGRFGSTPGLAAYHASKRALEGWPEELANRIAQFGT